MTADLTSSRNTDNAPKMAPRTIVFSVGPTARGYTSKVRIQTNATWIMNVNAVTISRMTAAAIANGLPWLIFRDHHLLNSYTLSDGGGGSGEAATVRRVWTLDDERYSNRSVASAGGAGSLGGAVGPTFSSLSGALPSDRKMRHWVGLTHC